MVNGSSSPFGSQARTRVLLALQALGESYPRELSRVLSLGLASVQRALQAFERDGLVVARSAGRTRLYRLNPRALGKAELESYLERLLDAEVELRSRAADVRRRPRRTGKPR